MKKNIEAITTLENIDTAYGYKKQKVKVNGEQKIVASFRNHLINVVLPKQAVL